MTTWTGMAPGRVGPAEELPPFIGHPRTLDTIRHIDDVMPSTSGEEPS